MLNINNYYDKYIKYKLKYLKLIKNNTIIIGGAPRQLKVNSLGETYDLDINDDTKMTMAELFELIRVKSRKSYIGLLVNDKVIYRPCKSNDSDPPIIFDYEKMYDGHWDYIENDKYDNTISEFEAQNSVRLDNSITILDGVYDIVTMYLDFIGNPNPVDEDRNFNIVNHRSVGLHQYIYFPKRLTDPDILSYIQSIIDKIEINTPILTEEKVNYYGEIVAFLLDHDKAKEAIKQIIRMCPFAFKGYPGEDNSIINTFFETLYAIEQYLNPNFHPEINTNYSYYYHEILGHISRKRIPSMRFKDVMIPKNCLSNQELIDRIIEIIRITTNENIKKVQVIILVYACDPNMIGNLIRNLRQEIITYIGPQYIDNQTLTSYKDQLLRVMLNPQYLGLHEDEDPL